MEQRPEAMLGVVEHQVEDLVGGTQGAYGEAVLDFMRNRSIEEFLDRHRTGNVAQAKMHFDRLA